MEAERILRLLPAIWQQAHREGSVLDATLSAMETLHAPVEAVLRDRERHFDPRRAPEGFLRLLASWTGLGDLVEGAEALRPEAGRAGIPDAALRELVVQAAALARARGTAGSLCTLLELATGVPGFELRDAPPDAAGRPTPFAAELLAPAAARGQAALVALVVAREKPAFATVAITWRDA